MKRWPEVPEQPEAQPGEVMTHHAQDQVRITDPRCRYFGHVGTIAEIDPERAFPYGVAGLEDWLLWFGDGELVKVAPEAQEGA